MRAIALRRFLFALNVAALILAGMATGIAPPAAAATGMSAECAHCRTDPACATMPLCGIAACGLTAIMRPMLAAVAALSLSSTEYGVGRAAPLAGETPMAEPPPPKLLLAG